MKPLRDISIRHKQTLIILLTSGVALLLACAAFMIYDLTIFRHEMVQRMSSLAEVVGNNSTAALDFNDPTSARESLASLRGEPTVTSACIYDQEGRPFATYTRADSPVLAAPPVQVGSHEFADKHLLLFRTIKQGGEAIGTIYIASSLDEFKERVTAYVGIVAVFLAVSLLVALIVSSVLQRVISLPILQLAAAARTVAEDKNYSLRAKKHSGDELGELVDGFNEMLAEIQERDFALQAARETLEHSVRQRTQELASSVSLLNATLEASMDGILAVDREGRITSCNRKFVELWGFTSEVMARRQSVELLPLAAAQLKNADVFRTQFRAMRESPETEAFDVLEFLNGRVVECLTKPQYIGDRCVGTVITYRDITERKQTEITTSVFSKLGRRLSAAASREEASRLIGEVSEDLFGWDAFAIQVYSSRDDTVCTTFEMDTFEGQRVETPVAPPRKATSLHHRIFESGAELILRDATTFLPGTTSFGNRSRPSASIMYVPVRTGDDIVGLLSVHSYSSNAYTEQDLATLQTLADHCGGALKRIEADEALRESETQFRLVWDTSVDGMRLSRRDGTVLMVNDAYCRMVEKTKAEVELKPLTVIHCAGNAEQVLRGYQEKFDTAGGQSNLETEVTLWNGRKVWFELSNSILNLPGQPRLLLSIFRNITERKAAEAELDSLHRQLLGVSRQAGMAEVATSVLHNVGNVLNSVNTSAGILTDRLRTSRVSGVSRVTELLETNRHDLAGFLTANGRADQVINFLKSLSLHLTAENTGALDELQGLTNNIEHIKEIVAMQQSYARISGVTEKVKPTDLVEDALRMNAGALTRHQVRLVREYAPDVPEIIVEKHKVLQVLVNLIRNAKHACDDSDAPDKSLTLRVTHDARHVRIAVVDNGVGIPPENLARIFSHGFTTRKTGHGFGLHSGALAAKELGGSLTVASAGPDQGATFTLELPCDPPGVAIFSGAHASANTNEIHAHA